MVFSSIIFLFLFLPLALGIYHLLFLPVTLGFGQKFWRRASNLFLLFASLVFYFWGEQFLVWIVITSTLIDFVCGLLVSAGTPSAENPKLGLNGGRPGLRKFALVTSICSNLAFLGVFKYFNFGVDSYNNLIGMAGLSGLRLENVIRITLPLGISFYTFQSMSYTIDVYRGKIKATRNLIDFACYVTMFPQLVAGPIIRYRDIASQLVHRVMSLELFASGVRRFIIGLGKKVLIANTVAIIADKVFELPISKLSTGVAWLGIVAYTLQIYYDFSGYSDMAIGLGRMLGFKFQENFNYPYISRSVREFWRRWHISLSSWFRDYLYIPLGGSRCSTTRTYFNLVLVFFLCGLWHGASVTFIAWGIYHGVFLILERTRLRNLFSKLPGVFGYVYALLVVMCGWVIFTSETLSYAAGYLAAMAGFTEGAGVADSVSQYLSRDTRMALIIGVIFAAPLLPALKNCRERLVLSCSRIVGTVLESGFSAFRVASLCAILIICMMFLSAGTHNPFIYFRF